MKSRLALGGLVAMLLVSAAAFSQTSASLVGSVRDPSAAAVANAQITVASADRGIVRNTTSNTDGEWAVPALPSGKYDLSVTAPGFRKFEARGVVLQVGQKARVEVAMQVGAASTEITVEGTAIAQVETQSSDLSGTVTGNQITQLQLNGRNFTQLVTLVPGVSNQTGQDEGTVGVYGNVGFSINGGRLEYNNWELDGGDNMDNGSNSTLNVYPSLESIAEFKVLTSNYGAQYGRNGSGTIEVETKSGTSSFHGTVWEFVRNDAFNARNYFQSTVPPYKKNDYGYNIGGPVYIPGVYNTKKSKTFFFWSQNWRKDRVPGQDFNQLVPSAAERSGDFTDVCPNLNSGTANDFSDCPVVNGVRTPVLTGLPEFQANQAVAQGLLGMIPLPTEGVPGAQAYLASPVQPTNWREELIRVDHNVTDQVRATFRYIHDSWDTVTPVPLWTNQGSFPTIQTGFKGPGVSLVTRLTATVSPTLLNEFVFSYTTDHIVLNNVGTWQRPSNFPIGDLFGGNGDGILPGINLSGGGAYGGGFGQDAGYIPNGPYNSNPTYTLRDNVSKIVGRHNLQFGAYAVFAQKNELGGELSAGSIPGYLTFDPSNTTVGTGNAFADLLLGRISSFGQQDKRIKYFNRYKILEPYFQDDWHVTSRLTLNLGLRLSLFGTYREKEKQVFNFDPAKYVFGQTTINADGTVSGLTANGLPPSLTNLPNGIVQCGVTPGVPVSCMDGHLFNPAPRIGFAWDVRGNGKTAIRGGYGIFFEHANGNEGNTESLENSPPLATTEQQNNITGYANIGSGFNPGAQAIFPLNVTAIPTKATWPYVQQWHLDIQQELTRNTVATLSYVGSKGTYLNRSTNLNQIPGLPAALNPYQPGEAINFDTSDPTSDCNTGTTSNGVPVTGQAATNLTIACGGDPNPFRKYLGYSDINHLEYASSSIYHALQGSVRRSMGSLQLSLAYTYSHSIDDSSSRYDGSFVDSFNPAGNRGSSNFDERHILNFSYVWALPFFKNPGITRTLMGGWVYSGIASFQTGIPFSVVNSPDNAGVANGLASSPSYADLVGDPNSGTVQVSVPGLGPLLYNPNAFAPPTGLTFGNAGRNVLRNPNRTNFDMALFKRFPIKEQIGFEFRAEAFNVFNHTQWGYIAGDGGSGASNTANLNGNTNTIGGNDFLHIATAHNPRILQLGLKFTF
jgi:hypothetical protein